MTTILDEGAVESLMFDDSFTRSQIYFSFLQLLPSLRDWISETGTDLEYFGTLLDREYKRASPESQKTLRDNWEKTMMYFSEAEARLHRRITIKTEELTRLRDGVCSLQYTY